MPDSWQPLAVKAAEESRSCTPSLIVGVVFNIPADASMTLQQVRSFALSLPGTMEAPHFNFTSFRIRSRIFATAPPDGEYLHVFVSEEQRLLALAQHPDFLEELVWGSRVPGLRVLLAGAKVGVVHQLLMQAWVIRASKRQLAAHQAG